MLMAQPLLARLHEKLAGARIEVLAPPWVAPVVRRMPEVADVIEEPLRHGSLQLLERWRLARRLKTRSYDQAIVLPNSWKSALVPFLADIPLRSGYLGESRYGLLNLRYRGPAGSERPDMRLFYARLAEQPDAQPIEPLPQVGLRVSREEIAAVQRKFGVAGEYAVLCPGAEYGPAKRWPYFAELSRRLGVPAVTIGSASDAPSAQWISGTNLVGKTTLDEAIGIIAGAKLVLSNDSGLMHVAAALQRPQLALFGSSSPQHTPPASPRAQVLWLHVDCSPCYQRECPLGHFKCMRDMSVEMVLNRIDAIS